MKKISCFFLTIAFIVSQSSYAQWLVRPVNDEKFEEFERAIALPVINDTVSTYSLLWAIEYDSTWLNSLITGQKYVFISDDSIKHILENNR